jgi:anti-sigma factor RsiW
MEGSSMNCHKVLSLVSAYVDGELAGVEMLAVRRHLSECRECTSEYESLLTLKRMLGALQPKRPQTDLATRICRQLGQVSQPARERWLSVLSKHFHPFPSRIRLAASGLAVLAALLVIGVGGTPTGNILSPASVISMTVSADGRVPMTAAVPEMALASNSVSVRTAKEDPWLSPAGAPYSPQGSGFGIRNASFGQ